MIKKLSKSQQIVLRLGGMMMIFGAATFLFLGYIAVAIYVVGAFMFASMQMLQEYQGNNFILARLRRQQMFGAFCIVISALLMIAQVIKNCLIRQNEWVICLAIGVVTTLYSEWRISAELKK